jgi:epoxyqueuosine reductase
MTMAEPDIAALWNEALGALARAGWRARVAPVERLDDLRTWFAPILASGATLHEWCHRLHDGTAYEIPAAIARPRSVVVAAIARPLTQATLTWEGAQHTVSLPPHYAGYREVPKRMHAVLAEALAGGGFSAAGFYPPLKTLAAFTGLARYGRNNISYVPGFGSYLQLAAAVSDAPPPDSASPAADDTSWGEPQLLTRCEPCIACLRACPTGAIAGERFLFHPERCLTAHNEADEPFPAWIDPEWHHCAVGCLRCQQACPENARVGLRIEHPERFDEDETASILDATRRPLPAATAAKLERCGLDYSATLIARNLRVMLTNSPRRD